MRKRYAENRDEMLARSNARAARLRAHPFRLCERCGRKARSQRHHYCAACAEVARDERLQKRGELSSERLARARELDALRTAKRRAKGLTTAARGYGLDYQKERKHWAGPVAAEEVVCWRCLKLIASGQYWDLGHDDFDRSIIRGPEHQWCNRAAAARLNNRRSRRVSVVL